MSQRLHVGKTDDIWYNAIVTSKDDAKRVIIEDFLIMGNGKCIGPWKIRISDFDLWRVVEPMLEEIFEKIGQSYPECVWLFYTPSGSLNHPTRQELDALISLETNTNKQSPFQEWWNDMDNGCPQLVLNNDEEFAVAVWNAAIERAIQTLPGGSSCDPQRVADDLRESIKTKTTNQ